MAHLTSSGGMDSSMSGSMSIGHSSGSEDPSLSGMQRRRQGTRSGMWSRKSGSSYAGSQSGGEQKEGSKLIVTPWYPEGISKTKMRLGDEIETLSDMLKLTPEETAQRHVARSTIQEVLQKIWPEATVKVYGSFAYGLSLPQSSLDLVAEDCGDLNELQDLFAAFEESRIEIIGSNKGDDSAFARLRIGSLCANVTFVMGKSSARKSVGEVRRLLEQFPACTQVFTIVRLVLQQSRCGNSRQGGLASYAALVMLLHACYTCEEPSDPCQLLVHFFRLYGSGAGPISEPIFVEDPLSPDNDVAAGCTRMPQIRAMFQNCAMTLEKWTSNKWDGYRGRSPLSSILAYDGLWPGTRPSSDKFST